MDKHTQMTDYELELLINEVEGTQMLEAPKRLKDEVLMKSRSIQTQTARQVTKASVRVELFLYGLNDSGCGSNCDSAVWCREPGDCGRNDSKC